MIVIKWRFKCQPQRERVFVLCYVTALQQIKTTTDTVILEGHHQLCLLETKNLRKCKNTSIYKLPAKKTNKKEELQNTRKFNVGQVRAGSWLCRVRETGARQGLNTVMRGQENGTVAIIENSEHKKLVCQKTKKLCVWHICTEELRSAKLRLERRNTFNRYNFFLNSVK